jgi:hypothetical protein
MTDAERGLANSILPSPSSTLQSSVDIHCKLLCRDNLQSLRYREPETRFTLYSHQRVAPCNALVLTRAHEPSEPPLTACVDHTLNALNVP